MILIALKDFGNIRKFKRECKDAPIQIMLKNCRSQNYAKFTSKLGKGSGLMKNTGFKPAKFSGLDNIIEFFLDLFEIFWTIFSENTSS